MSEQNQKVEDKPVSLTPEQLEAQMKELGLHADTIKKAVEAGVLIYKPSKLDQLPDELKEQMQHLIKEESTKEAGKAKEQLYASLENYKNKVEELTKHYEEEKRKASVEEQAKQEASQKAEYEKLSFEDKLQKLEKERIQREQEMSSTYESRLKEMETQLRKSQLVALKERMLSQYGQEIMPELVVDVESNPDTTPEQLEESVKKAHETYKAYAEKFQAVKPDATQDQEADPFRKKNPMDELKEYASKFRTSERDSHLHTNQRDVVDLERLKKSGTKEEVEAAAQAAFAAMGL